MVLCIEKMSNNLGDRGQTIFYALKKASKRLVSYKYYSFKFVDLNQYLLTTLMAGVEVFGKTHSECVRLIKNSGNTIKEMSKSNNAETLTLPWRKGKIVYIREGLEKVELFTSGGRGLSRISHTSMQVSVGLLDTNENKLHLYRVIL